jgi:glyoxylase-like metal-dependent hydrolase (beta-lactamase superfamily II)
VQQLVHDTAARALAPYRDTGRFVTFGDCGEVLPGVRPVNLAGHTPGHTGYLLGEGDTTVLFWGDTHSHTVQLRRPSVTMAADSDEPAAIAARRNALNLVSSNQWWVGAAHLPFPGLGHVRRTPTATPGCRSATHRVAESSTESPALCTDRKRTRHKATRRSGEVE